MARCFVDPCKTLLDKGKQHDTEYVEALYGVSPPLDEGFLLPGLFAYPPSKRTQYMYAL